MPTNLPPPLHERQVSGEAFDLPLVDMLGIVRKPHAHHIPWHAHEGYHFLFLLEGAAAYEFRGGATVGLSGGRFLLVPRGMVHRGARNVRTPAVLCGILFTPTRRQAWRNSVFTPADLRLLDRQLREAPLAARPFPRPLRRTIVRIMDDVEALAVGSQDAATKARLRALVCQAIVETTEQVISAAATDPAQFAAAAEAYLNQHFTEPVRMSDLTRHLGLSRTRVFELFKHATGLTPNHYLVRRRIAHGCELLTTTDRSITDIALATGFSSTQYFCNVFLRSTGMRPTQYRRDYANDR
jgi:AraC-like DNA-binding protein